MNPVQASRLVGLRAGGLMAWRAGRQAGSWAGRRRGEAVGEGGRGRERCEAAC